MESGFGDGERHKLRPQPVLPAPSFESGKLNKGRLGGSALTGIIKHKSIPQGAAGETPTLKRVA